jgi:hypothetical protein
VAAFAESSYASAQDHVDPHTAFEQAAVVGAIDHRYSEDRSSEFSDRGSEVSCPTRGWASMAGSVCEDPALAVMSRPPGCHLSFSQDHFVMACPLLEGDAKAAATTTRPPLPWSAQRAWGNGLANGEFRRTHVGIFSGEAPIQIGNLASPSSLWRSPRPV